jgi:UDP-glucose 4-epimerase
MSGVFITGVAGFLGSHMARHFSSLGWKIHGTDACDAEAVSDLGLTTFHSARLPDGRLGEWIGSAQVDLLVHCAGRASVPLSMTNPTEDFEGNTRVVQDLLESCRAIGFSGGVLLMSSAAVYGNPDAMPVGEDAKVRPVSAYGYHKRQAELLFEEYARIFGLKTGVLRIFSAYGAGLRRQVLWDLSEKILSGSGPLVLQGTGAETRDFIHASDVARAAALIAERGAMEGEVYNVASGEEMPIRRLAALLCESLGVERELKDSGRLPDGVPARWLADISRLRALGFEPSVSFPDGVAEFAAWARTLLTPV